MAFFSWSRWLRSLLRPQTKPIHKNRSQLRVEPLESRLAPAQFIWSGAGGDGKWANPSNWQGGQAPSTAVGAINDLIFQQPTAGSLGLTNNIGTGSSPLKVNSITFSTSGYTLGGNAIILGTTSGALTGQTGQINVPAAMSETIGFGLTLGGAGTSQQIFNVGNQGVLTIGGSVSGTAGAGWQFSGTGSGTMVLGADNSKFTGAFTVAGGIVQIQTGTALGTSQSASNVTTVLAGAQLQLNSVAGIVVPEHIRLNKTGPIATGNAAGALLNVAGDNVWSGLIELDSDVTVGAVQLTATITAISESGTTVTVTTAGPHRLQSNENVTIAGVSPVGYNGTFPITVIDATHFSYTAAAFLPPAFFTNAIATYHTSLTVSGQNSANVGITDLGATQNITKEGGGTIVFSSANTYRGKTTINDGILTIQNSQALGTTSNIVGGSQADQVIVNSNFSNNEIGTLQLDGPNTVTPGLTIVNKLLVLNGPGFGTVTDPANPLFTPLVNELGALDNLQGNNTWTGNINFGGAPTNPDGDNNPTIRTDPDNATPHASLTITGVVSDPYATGGNFHAFSKVGTGELILTSSNTYQGSTTIAAGTLQIDDSEALGQASGLLQNTSTTRVLNGATLQLAVDNIADSLTQTRNTLNVYTPLNITGNGDGNIGALSNLNGINIYYGKITLVGNASIGVTADPNPTNTAAYFTNDFSLTVEPPGGFGNGTLTSFGSPTLTKEGGGQLILPTANDAFAGNWNINQGWVTIENSDSLGALLNVGQQAQPTVTVRPNAALMLDAPTGTTLNLHQNFNLAGTGVNHPFSEIDQQGAVENIAGINSIEGNIKFSGPAGIGVETVFGPSQLSILGEQSAPAGGAAIPVGANASGSSAENDNIIDTGATSGSITINYNMYYIPDTIDVYYGVKGAGGIDIKSTGPISGSGSITVPYAPIGSLTTTTVEIVFDQGGGPSGTAWSYTALIKPNGAVQSNNITKLGSGALDIQGDGTFTGPMVVQQGVLIDQNSTGLGAGGAANSTVTVQPGAALALANGTAYNNGSVEGGIQVSGEHLIVNTNPNLQTVTVTGSLAGTFALSFGGQTTPALAANIPATGGTLATDSLQNALQALVTSVAGNSATVTVTQTGDVYNVVFGGSLAGTTQQLSVTAGSVTSASTNVIVGSGIGNSTLGAPVAPLTVLGSATSPWNPAVNLFQSSNFLAGLTTTTVPGQGTVGSNTIMPIDVQWLGPVTLNGPTAVDVPATSRLIIGGAIDDAGAGGTSTFSDLIKVGIGELTLGGINTYAGSTYVGTSGGSGTGGNPDGVSSFFTGGAAVPGGVVTAANNQALGAGSLPSVQLLTLTNAIKNTTQFQLNFNSTAAGSATTGPILYGSDQTATALAIQNALNSLPNIGGMLLDASGNVTQPAGNPAGQVSVTPTGTDGQFSISFGGSFAGFNQLLLQPAVTTGANTGSAAVTLVSAGTGGVVVQNGASLQLEGNITIAGKTLEMAGQGYNPAGVPLVVPAWAPLGPGVINNGPTISNGTAVTAGRVTSIAVDPTDPSGGTIYVATAGGGAFKTINDGQTWTPIFDNGGSLSLGAIAIAPTNPHVLYIGTGEADRSTDSFAGVGVYKSVDDGHTWTLLKDDAGGNPIKGLSVAKIAVDTLNSNLIYVATGNEATNADPNAVPGVYRFNGATWTNMTAIVSANRQNSAGGQAKPPDIPGPDDNYLLSFPQNGPNNPVQVTWSDVAVVGTNPSTQVIYAALGSTDGTYVTNYGKTNDANAVYFGLDPSGAAANFAWYIGDGKLDGETSTVDFPQFTQAGNIKMSVVLTNPGFADDPIFWQVINVQAVYASAVPPPPPGFPGTAMMLLGETSGVVGSGSLPQYLPLFPRGMIYTANKPTVPADGLDEYNLSIYSTVVTLPTGQVTVPTYIGTQSTLQFSADASPGGVTFSDLTTDGTGNSPHASFHALTGFGNSIYAGTDGGIWQLNTAAGANTWTDINGNLNNALVYSISSASTTPGNILEATQASSVAYYTPGVGWTMGTGADKGATFNTILPYTSTATRVVVSPQNPNIAMAFVNDDIFANSFGDQNLAYWPLPDFDPFQNSLFGQPNGFVGYLTTLMLSTDGGKTWAPVPPYDIVQYYVGSFYNGGAGPEGSWGTFGDYTANDEFQPALVADQVNGLRMLYTDLYDLATNLVAGRSVNETLNGGTTFNPLSPPNSGGLIGKATPIIPVQMALATYQGLFQADADFPAVTDQGANTNVPGTMYIAGPDQANPAVEDIYITRDYSQTWVQRNLPVAASNITDLEVDPTNSSVVYATIGGAPGLGTGRIWKSTQGGASPGGQSSWVPIGGITNTNGSDGLPDVAVNKLVIDPRTGNLYAGTDQGVYVLASGSSKWAPLGIGMPNVRVTDLYLNQATNSLVAGTYGRGVWQIPLSDVQANAGSLTAVTGQSQWTGPVVLTGATTISAQGSPSFLNNLTAAQLNISGTISDSSAAITTNAVTVGSSAGAGIVTFSGANSYAGGTTVADGVLVSANLTALGATNVGTTVMDGAALELAASLDAEPVTLNGNGVAPGINGHNTGALEGVASNITFQGPITLASPEVTIGVESGASLRLTGTIGGNGNLTKELTGTLILDETQPNTYLDTTVNQGLLLMESTAAMAANASITVLDGAQIGLMTPTDTTDPNFGAPVTGQGTLSLSGTGIQNEGALVNFGGKNTWSGAITLDGNAGFSATTYPVGTVTIGVGLPGATADPTDVLAITGNISEGSQGLYSGIIKTGPDTLVLAGSNSYTGTTFINSGVVTIQNALALGAPNTNPIQRVNVFDNGHNGTFTLALTLNGQTLTTSPIPAGSDASTMATRVQSQLNVLLSNLGYPSITTTVTGASSPVPGSVSQEILLSIVFQGAGLAGLNLPQLVALAAGGSSVVDSEVADNMYGTEVAAGAALQLDLASSPTGQTVSESLQLNATGPTNAGAMENVSGNNTWAGTVNLQTSSSIGVDTNPTLPSQLSITGDVTGPVSSALSKVGGGTLGLAAANQYQGTTFIQTGILSAQNNLALGGSLTDQVQTITLTGALTGTYELSFTDQHGNTVTTQPISGQATANQLAAALNLAVQQLPGAPVTPTNSVLVSLSPTGSVYTVIFVGPFAGVDLGSQGPLALVSGSNTPGLLVGLAPITEGGLGNTIVSAGATLQLANNGSGDVHISTEQVILNGNGATGTQTGIANAVEGGATGTTVTITTATPNAFQTGELITISGIVPTGYDGTFQITVVDSTHFTYTAPAGLGTAAFNGAQATPVGGNGALESVDGANLWDPNTTPLSPSDPTIPDSRIILNGSATIGVDADAISGAPGLTIDQTIAESKPGSQLTKVGAGTLLFNGTTTNTYSGLTTDAAGTLELSKTGVSGSTVSISNVSVSGSTVTVTTATANGFTSGQFITIAGITPQDYSGTFAITVVDATHFTYVAPSGLGVPALNAPTATPAIIAIPANLQIGAGTGGLNSAVTQLEQPSGSSGALELRSSATVTILSDGSFDPNGQTQTVGALNMTGGSVNLTNTASSFTVSSYLVPGSSSVGGGTVTATEDANGNAAVILGGAFASGTFALGGGSGGRPVTFNITAPATGPDQVDLDVQPSVVGTNSQLVKTGNGRLELDADSTTTLTNAIIDSAGDVQVDGAVGDVSLTGGGVSGRGTIGVMDGAGGHGSVAVGTVAPGDNGNIANIGILHNNTGSTSERWGTSTTFSIDLTHNSTNTPQPQAGTDYDVLLVNGNAGTNLDLGGAALAGTSTGNINLGDKFTIIQATGANYISGQFAAPAGIDSGTGMPIAYVGGSKFDVQYVPDGSGITGRYSQVILIRTPQTAVLGLSSSLPSASYGQDVTFTAVATIDNGLGSAPVGSTITFTLDKGTPNQLSVSKKVVNNRATFDPAIDLSTPLSVGSHTVDAQFDPGNTNAINSPSAPQVQQSVVSAQSTTSGTLVFGGKTFQSGASFAYSASTPVQLVVTVNPSLAVVANAARPGSGDMVRLTLTDVTTGQVFTDTEPLGSPGNPANGYTFSLFAPTLAIGSYRATISYLGSASNAANPQNYYQPSNFGPISFNVTADVSTLTLTAQAAQTNSGTTSVFGQLVTFTAVVQTNSPGTATPNVGVDVITFTDNGGALGTVPVTQDPATGNYIAVLSTNSLTVGQHTIRASYSGNSKLSGSSGQLNPEPFIVNVDGSQTILSANPTGNWSFGQAISFTATVLAIAPGSGTPSGTVNFYDAIPSQTNPTLLFSTTVGANGLALFTTSGLAHGPHAIFAVYGGSANFGTSTSAQLKQTVLVGTTTVLASTENPAAVGDTITLIANVSPNPASAGTPTGTVTFSDGGTLLASGVTINSAGQYVLVTSTLTFGNHPITATFVPNANTGFGTSTSAILNQAVRSQTGITLSTASANPSGAGMPIQLTAVVAGIPAGNGNPVSGIVSFYSNNLFIGQQNVGANGIALFTTPALARGTYSFTAAYGGNTLYAPSPFSNALNQSVVLGTTTTVSVGPSATTNFGSTVTLTATVRASSGSTTVPTGIVNFYDMQGGSQTLIGTVGLNSTGKAILTIPAPAGGQPASPLSVGVHPIVAVYAGDGSNFAGSQNATPVKETVQATAATTVTSSGTPVSGTTRRSAYSEPVAFTATVTTSAPVTLTGTVTFYNGSVLPANKLDTESVVLSGGSYVAVSQPISTLSVVANPTNHTILAVYTPGANEATKSTTGTMIEQVVPDPTTTTVTSSNATTSFGETVTFTATVTNAPGTADPIGTVSFFNGAAATIPMSGGAKLALVKVGTNDYEATFATSTLTVTAIPHTIKAVFNTGSAIKFTTSSGTTTQTVQQASTTTTVSSSLNPSATNEAVTLTAAVAGPGGGATGGTVQFSIDGSTFGGARTVTNGIATVTVPAGSLSSTVGLTPHQITAAYSGNTSYTGSDNTANPYLQDVFNATKTTVSANVANSSVGDTVTFTATVSDPNNPGSIPTGTVTFTDTVGGVTSTLGSASVDPGTGLAVFPTDGLSAGANTITATYGGDGSSYAASVGTTTEGVFAVATSMKVKVSSPSTGLIMAGFPFALSAQIFDSNGSLITTQAPGSTAQLILYKGTNSTTGVPIRTATATFSNGKFTFSNLRVSQGVYDAQITYNGVTVDFIISTAGRVS